MAADKQTSVRSTTGSVRPDSAEARLDMLFEAQSRRQMIEETQTSGPQATPMDKLRLVFADELVPAFEELRAKYDKKSVKLALEVDSFLQGGRTVAIVIEFSGAGLRLDGVVMPGSIAFQQTRYAGSVSSGVAASGPTLRTRDLNAQVFRDFVCDRLGSLVQSTVHQRRPNP